MLRRGREHGDIRSLSLFNHRKVSHSNDALRSLAHPTRADADEKPAAVSLIMMLQINRLCASYRDGGLLRESALRITLARDILWGNSIGYPGA